MTRISFGRLQGGTVRSAVGCICKAESHLSGAVIRSLDSARSQELLLKILALHGVKSYVVASNVCVATRDLGLALEKEVFTGFDEVWIFRNGMPNLPLDSVVSATSDSEDFGIELPVDVAEAIDESGCVLVVGDGCGLNYAGQDEDMIDKIRSITHVGTLVRTRGPGDPATSPRR